MPSVKVLSFFSKNISKPNFKSPSTKNLHTTPPNRNGCSNTDTKSQIFQKVCDPVHYSHNKVSVMGVNETGIAIALGLLTQKVTGHIALFDSNEKKIEGEMLDLRHGACFLNNPKIEASVDPQVMTKSRLTVLALGETPKNIKTDMCQLAKTNAKMMKTLVPLIFKYSPDTLLLVLTPPVAAITYACAQIACERKHKIIGTGCNLDSIRFRFFMSRKYKVAGESCKGWVIGENGPPSVVLWSTLTVGGVRLCVINPMIGTSCDPENWRDVHKQVMTADYDLIESKGYVSWAVAGNVVDIIDSILNNSRKVFSLSVPAKGYYGICQDVYCSLPCVVGEGGVSEILTIPISDNEHEELIQSVCAIEKLQNSTCL